RRTCRRLPAAAAERADRADHAGRATPERRDEGADGDEPRAERGGQEDLGLGRHLLRADPGGNDLRHELQGHAGAALGGRLSLRHRADGRPVVRALARLQAPRLALSRGARRGRGQDEPTRPTTSWVSFASSCASNGAPTFSKTTWASTCEPAM